MIEAAGMTNSAPIDRFHVAEIWIFLNEDGSALQFRQRFQSNFLFGSENHPNVIEKSTRHSEETPQKKQKNVPVVAWVHKRRMRNQRGAAGRGWRPNWETVGRWSVGRRRGKRANNPWFPARPGSCDYSSRWQSPNFPSKQCEGNLPPLGSPPIPKIVGGRSELLYWDKLVQTRTKQLVNKIFQTLGGREPNERAPLKLHTRKWHPPSIAPSAPNRNYLGASKSIKSKRNEKVQIS